ncbi:amidophosphoribosyltransferase [Phaeocystidibacter marisrubri]|nr:amidophosphoribosyltransferase [Phaeocystidibacter marisrubri]
MTVLNWSQNKVNAFSITAYKSIYQNVLTIWMDAIFPKRCLVCFSVLSPAENACCHTCLDALPLWPSEQDPEEFANQLFGGRVKIEGLQVHYPFHSPSAIQHLLHAVKYDGNTTLAKELGVRLGRRWTGLLPSETIITPVPLHPFKMKNRGYNQSWHIARGIGNSTHLNCEILLRRTVHTPSQTALSREERWKNMEGIFEIADGVNLVGSTVLLVDDTLTTGATLESCAHTLLKAGVSKVYATAIAYAS